MGLLQVAGQGPGYLKAGFQGFQGSGKTFTAALLAIGTRDYFGLDGPIAMADSEGGAVYVNKMTKELCGLDLIVAPTQAFSDLVKVGEEAINAGASVLIVDSMTHYWKEIQESHLATINRQRRQKNWGPRDRLEFQDWAAIKRTWAQWTDFYLNSKLHIVIAGRAGFEYGYQENEQGKKELIKTGVKMKAESEFGYEPSLLVEMEREQSVEERAKTWRTATVLKDRFNVIDGQVGRFVSHREPQKNLDQTMAFFRPYLDCLVPGAHTPIDTALKTDTGVDETGDDEWQRRKRERAILCEELQAELLLRWPSQSASDKAAKAAVIKHLFGTGSWTKVESMQPDQLRDGLAALKTLDIEEFFANSLPV